jgi:hypothetical protein
MFQHPNTAALIAALLIDEWPSLAVCVDFGIPPVPQEGDGYGMYGLLQWGYMEEDAITMEELDDACCCGPRLTMIVKRMQKRGCPYGKDIEKIEVPWDNMSSEEEDSVMLMPSVKEKIG